MRDRTFVPPARPPARNRTHPGPVPPVSSSNSLRSNAATEASAYGLVFWLCYLANTALMIAVSLLFRYSDFVITYLGGTEFQLGLIVGVGMVGAIAMRLFQGIGIDRYGSRSIWLGSLLLFIVATLLHLAISSASGGGIFLARILWMVSVAGAFGASLAYISLRVPEQRIAEMIGTLGTSGFLGLAVGPALGDLLFDSDTVTRAIVNRMFLWSAGMGAVSLVCALIATVGTVRQRPRRRVPPLAWLIRRYHPGPLLVVAAAMGLSVSLPNTFLRSYTASLGIDEIRNFFLVYAFTAFVVRIGTRRLTQRVGYTPLILTGLAAAATGMLLYLLVSGKWTLVIPGAAAGVAHALLFPAVMAAGSISFPSRYRGVATTLTLALFDTGSLVGQPTVGFILWWAETRGLPAYPIMFTSVAVLLAFVGGFYGWYVRQPRRKRVSPVLPEVGAANPGGAVEAVPVAVAEAWEVPATLSCTEPGKR